MKRCCLDGITDQHPYKYAGGACDGCPRTERVYEPTCCHKTRLVGAACPVGRKCPYDTPAADGSKSAHLPVRTPEELIWDHLLTNWSA